MGDEPLRYSATLNFLNIKIQITTNASTRFMMSQ